MTTAPADADTVAGVARAVPGVVDLHSGGYGEIATYLPGRRVTGVRIVGDRIEVQIVAAYDAPLRETADATVEAVSSACPGYLVDVLVADVATTNSNSSGVSS